MYLMSFLTLGILWIGQQTQLNHLTRSDRSLSWIHILFLLAVSITPFSTMLLAEFTAYRLALLEYWLNILLLGSTLYFSWVCATEKGLVKNDLTPRCSLLLKAASSSGKRCMPSAPCSASSALIGALRLSSWCNSTTQSRHVCQDGLKVFPLCTFVSFVVNEVKMLAPQRTQRYTRNEAATSFLLH
jgi:hypothetical protein